MYSDLTHVSMTTAKWQALGSYLPTKHSRELCVAVVSYNTATIADRQGWLGPVRLTFALITDAL